MRGGEEGRGRGEYRKGEGEERMGRWPPLSRRLARTRIPLNQPQEVSHQDRPELWERLYPRLRELKIKKKFSWPWINSLMPPSLFLHPRVTGKRSSGQKVTIYLKIRKSTHADECIYQFGGHYVNKTHTCRRGNIFQAVSVDTATISSVWSKRKTVKMVLVSIETVWAISSSASVGYIYLSRQCDNPVHGEHCHYLLWMKWGQWGICLSYTEGII